MCKQYILQSDSFHVEKPGIYFMCENPGSAIKRGNIPLNTQYLCINEIKH